ncbi:hypothetical protein DFP72DRAFT_273633 [Ephemerocybe angulata]|uniref:Uncharacterized protein n=1 Tax=Ephemerocybe angulata TaxID=980116 RepID=A0A8H6I2D7_9AGAR|nr:hypothetical protein DFP72DRAFT_273633 [Tulosesus angulatus]
MSLTAGTSSAGTTPAVACTWRTCTPARALRGSAHHRARQRSFESPVCHPNPLQPACSTSPLSSTGIRQATAAAATTTRLAGPPPSLSSSDAPTTWSLPSWTSNDTASVPLASLVPTIDGPNLCIVPSHLLIRRIGPRHHLHPALRLPLHTVRPDPPSYVYATVFARLTATSTHHVSPTDPSYNADDSTLQPNRNVKISCTTLSHLVIRPRTPRCRIQHLGTIIVGYSSRRGRVRRVDERRVRRPGRESRRSGRCSSRATEWSASAEAAANNSCLSRALLLAQCELYTRRLVWRISGARASCRKVNVKRPPSTPITMRAPRRQPPLT